MYTVRSLIQQGMPQTLEQVAGLGYRAVELAGYGGLTAPELKQALQNNNLQAISAHVQLASFAENPDRLIAELQDLGCQYAVVPWWPAENRADLASARQFATRLNEVGRLCQAASLKFGYHNHAFEFEPISASEASQPWQILAELLDPEVVKLELDVYWASFAGRDPVEVIQSGQGQIKLLHMKDLATVNGQRRDVPVGTGQINWTPVIEAGAASQVDWYIVELDNPVEPLTDVATGLQNLQTLLSH